MYGPRAISTVDMPQGSAICFALAATLLLYTEPKLPMLNQTPLRDWMDVPPVYRNAMDAFSECHIAKMTAPEFMDGIWEGYESRQGGWGNNGISVDANDNIHVITRRPTDSDYVEGTYRLTDIAIIIEDSTIGTDRLGSFTLHGAVNREGEVLVVKTDHGTDSTWQWRGRMMPYGIAGMWGSDIAGNFSGYFWIWKKAWVEPH